MARQLPHGRRSKNEMNTRSGLTQSIAKTLRRSLWLPKWLGGEQPRESLIRKTPARQVTPYDLSYPLLRFSESDYFTVGDSFEGVHIFGGNGSGKTSGPGSTVLKAHFRAGYGGLVLTAKNDESDLIRRYAAETGRLADLVIFSPEEKWRFNFLAYEQRRKALGAGLTANIVKLFSTIQDSFERGGDAGGKQERYWKNALNQLLHNAVDLILLSGENLSVCRRCCSPGSRRAHRSTIPTAPQQTRRDLSPDPPDAPSPRCG